MVRFLVYTGLLGVVLAGVAGCPTSGEEEKGGPGDTAQASGWISQETTTGVPAPINPVATETRWGSVDKLLEGWQPLLADATGDAKDKDSTHDIRNVSMILANDDLLVRYSLAADTSEAAQIDVRFWLEQGERFLTVQTRSASQDKSCTISEVGSAVERTVKSCFKIHDDFVDIAIPRTELPTTLDLDADFWLSGPQVCCMDEDRTEPIDELLASQVVWRMPE